jgi:hypothetical protein
MANSYKKAFLIGILFGAIVSAIIVLLFLQQSHVADFSDRILVSLIIAGSPYFITQFLTRDWKSRVLDVLCSTDRNEYLQHQCTPGNSIYEQCPARLYHYHCIEKIEPFMMIIEIIIGYGLLALALVAIRDLMRILAKRFQK